MRSDSTREHEDTLLRKNKMCRIAWVIAFYVYFHAGVQHKRYAIADPQNKVYSQQANGGGVVPGRKNIDVLRMGARGRKELAGSDGGYESKANRVGPSSTIGSSSAALGGGNIGGASTPQLEATPAVSVLPTTTVTAATAEQVSPAVAPTNAGSAQVPRRKARVTLMPVVDANFAGKNFLQLYTMQCYARRHGYYYELLNLSGQQFVGCYALYPHDFFFRKHCAIAQMLRARQGKRAAKDTYKTRQGGPAASDAPEVENAILEREWSASVNALRDPKKFYPATISKAGENGQSRHDRFSAARDDFDTLNGEGWNDVYVVLDSDMALATLDKSLDEWIENNPNDLTFYERSWNFEVMAGNYIVRNTAFTAEFLTRWAEFYHRRPPGFSSADQGAIHQLLLETMHLRGNGADSGMERCDEMYKNLRASVMDTKPYYRFVACTKRTLGPPRDWRGEFLLLENGGGDHGQDRVLESAASSAAKQPRQPFRNTRIIGTVPPSPTAEAHAASSAAASGASIGSLSAGRTGGSGRQLVAGSAASSRNENPASGAVANGAEGAASSAQQTTVSQQTDPKPIYWHRRPSNQPRVLAREGPASDRDGGRLLMETSDEGPGSEEALQGDNSLSSHSSSKESEPQLPDEILQLQPNEVLGSHDDPTESLDSPLRHLSSDSSAASYARFPNEETAPLTTKDGHKILRGGVRILPRWHGFAADGAYAGGVKCADYHIFHHGVKGSQQAGFRYFLRYNLTSADLTNLLSVSNGGRDAKAYAFLIQSLNNAKCSTDLLGCARAGAWAPRDLISQRILAGERWFFATKTGDHSVVPRWSVQSCLRNFQCRPMAPAEPVTSKPFTGREDMDTVDYMNAVPKQSLPSGK
ncbi:unnamed protein product [Amoebophrya sp. A25]|nr:unnamed protein product [Amoebophrya sp. A25]|eukprot:GSA25T00027233001.1